MRERRCSIALAAVAELAGHHLVVVAFLAEGLQGIMGTVGVVEGLA